MPAIGKLNLCLNIIGRRDDGYHELQTVFQLISAHDEIHFKVSDKLSLLTDSNIVKEDNLVYRAARALQQHTGTQYGAELKLTKRLPMGAGVGGGSSDAATTLLGLDYLWALQLAKSELLAIAKSLGADVPVFIIGKSAWAEGIGEQLSPLDLPHRYYIVIQPDCFISTAEIFLNSQLTRDSEAITIARFLEVGSGNNCEAIARKLYPEVDQTIRWLNQFGPAKMTGTGSCVFLDFGSEEEAKDVLQVVPANWRAFVTEGLNESPLINAIKNLSKT